jgi:hypothetical protein
MRLVAALRLAVMRLRGQILLAMSMTPFVMMPCANQHVYKERAVGVATDTNQAFRLP